MADADRRRLLERALALPTATEADFFGGRRPPHDADPSLLKIIADTHLRGKLLDARIAEGLQSPKGPQRIASIVRIYPDFDAPPRANASANGRDARQTPARGLPTVEEMAALVARIAEVERDVAAELSAETEERIDALKRRIGSASGDDLETTYRELGEALERKRLLAAQIRYEAFRRIEADTSFAPRAYVRLLAR